MLKFRLFIMSALMMLLVVATAMALIFRWDDIYG